MIADQSGSVARRIPRISPRSRAWACPDIEIRGDDSSGRGVFTCRPVAAGQVLMALAHVFVAERDQDSIQIDDQLHQACTGEIDDYLNHSCAANAAFDFEQLELVAIRSLGPDEEVCCNYLTFEWEMICPFTCGCGTPACVGEIKGFAYLSAEQQGALMPFASPYVRARLADVSSERSSTTPARH